MMRAPTVRGFQRTPSAGIFRRAAGFSPLRLPNLAAWYDLGPTRQVGTTSDDIRIDASNRVSLLADRSGNSGTNCLCLNGVVGNNATSPDSAALDITGDIDLQAEIAADDWSRAAGRYPISKYGAAGTRSYLLGIVAGAIELVTSADGTTLVTHTSTATVPFSNYSRGWIRATMDVDNGAGSRVVKFYTSTNGSTWTQLGSTVTTAGTTSIFSGTSVLTLGQFTGAASSLEGRIYRVRILNGYDGAGSVVFDANFALAGKLVSSFTESSSNAATVTINSSGDLGARISGERDLVQLTASKQPIYTAATATTPAFITFDGTDDYMGAAGLGFTSNAITAFGVANRGSAVAATSQFGRLLSIAGPSGSDFNSTNGILLSLNRVSNILDWFRNSASIANVAIPAVGTRFAFATVLNGATGSLRRDRNTAATGSTSATPIASAKFAVGAEIGALTSDSYLTGTVSEIGVYAAALDSAATDRLAIYLGRKWGTPLS